MAAATSPAFAAPLPATGLENLSLEQLAEIRVTSASRREERLAKVPASIFVISADDIRRSGATTIAEALRLAPNLFVGRGDASQAVVGARGQYAGTSNKMLVLIDGRTVYTPLFSGVFWDAQQVVLQDIDRIEVISGPAATLWGANGVNGVINITTRSAKDSQGTLIDAFGGDYERGGVARHGGTLGGDGFYRVYGKYRENRERRLEAGGGARDEAERYTLGFRADWSGPVRTATLEGEAYKADIGNLGGDRPIKGAFVLGRWSRPTGAAGAMRLQAYFDHAERIHTGTFREKLDILDLDLQHEWAVAKGNQLVAGAGYRHARDDVTDTPALGFDPAHRTLRWASVFVQDEWAVAPGVSLTGGLKAERNPYTGLEWLPNVRFAWTPAPEHLVWGALSRALRTPSRIDRDAFIPGVLRTSSTFESEIANVAELGYRAQLSPAANLSLTLFHHHYPNLRTFELAPPATTIVAANGFDGKMRGVEGWGSWRPAPWWRLAAGFTAMTETIRLKPGHPDVGGVTQISNDPRHTEQLRSSWDIGGVCEADLMIRRIGHIPNFNIPTTTVVDARLGWRATRDLELSVLVQNALDKDDAEFGNPAVRAIFGRSWVFKIRWQV
jgi:iron complex outermembrane receptor protein